MIKSIKSSRDVKEYVGRELLDFADMLLVRVVCGLQWAEAVLERIWDEVEGEALELRQQL